MDTFPRKAHHLLCGLVNPWHMHEGYGSRRVCVCACVCYHTSGYTPHLYIEKKVH